MSLVTLRGGVEIGDSANKSLAQSTAPKESDERRSPYRHVHRIGHAEGALQCKEVVNRDRHTRGALVHNALLIGSNTTLLDCPRAGPGQGRHFFADPDPDPRGQGQPYAGPGPDPL